MASSSSFQLAGERRGRWGSPERTVVWTEPKPKPKPARKLAVVYYLCHRDGHLDHPHFLEMELPRPRSSHLSPAPAPAPAGLYLRDFTARVNALRGNAMASMYSWSAKRSYRNGYVWQDLAEDDLVHPAHGGNGDEYVLKGSPLFLFPEQAVPAPPHQDQDASSSFNQNKSTGRHRKNWSSIDLGDYCNTKLVAQQSAATQSQTDHHGGPDRDADPSTTELAIHEISPPPSSSSPDDALEMERCSSREVGVIAGGRMRVSAVLMQLFSCGSMTTAVKRRGRHARTRSDLVTASGSNRLADKEVDAYTSARAAECSSVSGGGVGVVERDYFSGSLLVESGKKRGDGGGDDAVLLKRSSSCNVDRGAGRRCQVEAAGAGAGEGGPCRRPAGCLASRGSHGGGKGRSRDGGECKGPTADGHRPGGR